MARVLAISPSNEYSGLISFRMDWFDLLAVQVTLKSLLQHHSSKASIFLHSAFFIVQLSHLQFAPSVILLPESHRLSPPPPVVLLSVTLSILSTVPKVQALIMSHCFDAAAGRPHFFPVLPSYLLHTRADKEMVHLTQEPYF